MALPAEARAIPFSPGIAVQNDASYLGPIGSIRLGIKQPQIGHEVPFVVGSDLSLAGSEIVDVGVKLRSHPHRTAPPHGPRQRKILKWDNPVSGLPEWLLFFNGEPYRMQKSLRTPRQILLQSLLVEARKATGLTQAELADALGKPQSFVAKYENGERRIDVIEFVDIASALGIPTA